MKEKQTLEEFISESERHMMTVVTFLFGMVFGLVARVIWWIIHW